MDTSTLLEGFVEVLIAGDRPQARQIVDETLAHVGSPQDLIPELFWPAYELIEKLYRADQLTRLSHHCGTRLPRVLIDQNTSLFTIAPPSGRAAPAFCVPPATDAPGATHDVDLRALLESVEALAHERAHNQNIDLKLECPDDIGAIEADGRRLKQALFNLLSNAIKFTPEGGAVTVSVERAEGEVRLTVTDTGSGIRPEDIERVFGKFETGGGRSGQGGQTGAFLAITAPAEGHGHSVLT